MTYPVTRRRKVRRQRQTLRRRMREALPVIVLALIVRDRVDSRRRREWTEQDRARWAAMHAEMEARWNLEVRS